MKNKTVLLIIFLFTLAAANFFPTRHSHSYNTKTDCDINTGPCTKTIEHNSIQVILDINPKPVNPMKELLFSVILKEGESAVKDARVAIDLTMPDMLMGVNRPVLSHIKDGRYEGKGVLPVCPHGGKLWKANVIVERGGRAATVSYIFEVQ